MTPIRCTRCRQPYPEDTVPHRCPHCGGVFDFAAPSLSDAPPLFDPAQIDPSLPGMWRYRGAFDLPRTAPIVTLGEGNTPLIPVDLDGISAFLKMESLNPTGSYKDRGSAVLLSQLAARGVTQAVEDSSGNAGASFAAYAARAGVKARVFVPEAASGPKRGQIEAYGAHLVRVPGPRSAAAEAVLAEVQAGAVYASHAYLPFGLPGIASIAYEIFEQLHGAPGTVVAPVGHGGLLLGIIRGFAALHQAGLIDHLPVYLGVQARRCAPAWLAFTRGLPAMQEVEEGPTLAEGVRVRQPVRVEAILNELTPGSAITVVEEEAILPAYHALARAGVHVEPTSALAWAALVGEFAKLPTPITVIISAAGLKYAGGSSSSQTVPT